MNPIEIKDVSFSFGHQQIFDAITVSFRAGEIIGIVGKNGSGKSVFFKLLAGLIKPKRGEIWIDGKEIANSSSFASDMGVLIEEPSFLANLTAYDNLRLLLSINKKCSNEVIEQTLETVGLSEYRDKKVKHFSLGMKKKMGIAQAIMEKPKILLLDEPMNALDEESILNMRNLFFELAKQGTTIIIASHNREDIDTMCDKVYKIHACGLQIETSNS